MEVRIIFNKHILIINSISRQFYSYLWKDQSVLIVYFASNEKWDKRKVSIGKKEINRWLTNLSEKIYNNLGGRFVMTIQYFFMYLPIWTTYLSTLFKIYFFSILNLRIRKKIIFYQLLRWNIIGINFHFPTSHILSETK